MPNELIKQMHKTTKVVFEFMEAASTALDEAYTTALENAFGMWTIPIEDKKEQKRKKLEKKLLRLRSLK